MANNDDENRITYLATTDSRNKRVPFGIKKNDRARHMYIIGKTGMGKSTMLENMAIQDIRNGEGLAFVDPHGSSAEKLLQYVPEHRLKDVLYFAPFDMEYPIAFNVMEDVGYDKRHLVVSGLISAFRKIWEDAWSARMEYILSNTLLALLEYPDSTLLSVNRMLIDKVYRKKVVEQVTDPIVKSFWVDEFATYTDRYTQEATPAIQNKIGQFTSNPLIRNIVGQPNSTFDFRKMMDEKKIIIANLSKGRVGEVNAALLGSMFVTKLYLSAMSRADASSGTLAKLPPFFFYVDEFQSFANDTFADILSEARKYKLNLTIAHQYIEQMEENVRNAVFGNVGTTVAFRVGPFDAEVLEAVFQPRFMKEDLVNLGFAQIYLTLMIDGVGCQPFSALTLPPFDLPPQTFEDQIIASSRSLYARPRATVEGDVRLWQGNSTEEKLKAKPEGRTERPAPERERAPATQKPQKPEEQERMSAEREAPRAPAEPAGRTFSPVPPPQKTFERREPFRAPKDGQRDGRREERQPFRPVRPSVIHEKRREAPPLEGGSMTLKDAIAKAQKSSAVSGAESVAGPEQKSGVSPKPMSTLRDTLKSIQDMPPAVREEKPVVNHPVSPKPQEKRNEVPEEVLRGILKSDFDENP